VAHYTSINRPHFVKFHGNFEESGETDIVIEFIDGIDLTSFFMNGTP
jgi:hypothetical protein